MKHDKFESCIDIGRSGFCGFGDDKCCDWFFAGEKQSCVLIYSDFERLSCLLDQSVGSSFDGFFGQHVADSSVTGCGKEVTSGW